MIPGEAMSSRRAHLRTMGVGAYTGRMRLRLILVPLCAATLLAQTPSSPIVERVGDTGFIQLQAESFARSTPAAGARLLADAGVDRDRSDHLRPAVAVRPARRSGCSRRLSRSPAGIPPATFAKIRRVRACSSGRIAATTTRTRRRSSCRRSPFDELQQAALKAQTSGAFKSAYADLPPLATADALKRELAELRPSLFDPNVEPLITAKTPPPGKDILQASSNTFYRGVDAGRT